MTAFSIVLRILSMAACIAAVFFWNHKQKLIAQKETIIQESEYLVGFPELERSSKHQTTFNRLARVQTLSRIKADRPGDQSYQRMVKLRSKLEEIKSRDKEYGYDVMTIGGFDRNKNLSFHSHIHTLGWDLSRRKDQIDTLQDKNQELEEDLVVQKTLLGQEIEKVTAANATIQESQATIEDLEGKYGQLEETYDSTIQDYLEKIEQLRNTYRTKQEVYTRQNNILTTQLNEATTRVRLLEQHLEKYRRNATTEKGSGKVDDKTISEKDSIGKEALRNTLHTRFYKFSPQENRLALLSGASSGLQAYVGKPLTLLVGERQVEGLRIVKVANEYTLFRFDGSLRKAQGILRKLKSMDRVIIALPD